MTETPAPPAPAPDPAPRRPGAPRWMKIALVVSLAANLLVVGAVAGLVLRLGPGGHGGGPRDMASAIYLHALPPAERQRILGEFRRRAPPAEERRAAFRAELGATITLIRAEPFEPAALARRIAAQRSLFAERADLGDRLFVERLAAASPAERQAYADRLEAFLARAPGHRGP